MNDEQYNNLLAVLAEIRDRLPVPQIPEEPVTVRRMDGSRMTVGTPGPRKGSEMAAYRRQALAAISEPLRGPGVPGRTTRRTVTTPSRWARSAGGRSTPRTSAT
jgi:hypothetical protein